MFRYLELENRSLYDSLNERRNANVPKRTVLPCTKGIIFSGGSGRGLGRGGGGGLLGEKDVHPETVYYLTKKLHF